MVKAIKFSYSKDSDILYIGVKNSKKIQGSAEVGDFILDFTHDGELVGLEILNASKNIMKITKRLLSQINKIDFAVKYNSNHISIGILMFFPKGMLKEVNIPIMVSR